MKKTITLLTCFIFCLILSSNIFAAENTTPYGNVLNTGFGIEAYNGYILGEDKRIYRVEEDTLVPVDDRLTNVHKFTKSEDYYYGIIVLKEDGTVWKWDEQALNEGEDFMPAKGINKKVIDISSECAVLEDGTIVRFNFSSWAGNEVRVIQSNLKDVVQYLNIPLALTKDGTVWTWGESTIPVKVEGLTDIVQIQGGYWGNIYAVKKDGTVWTMEFTEFDNYGTRGLTKPIKVEGLSNIVKIYEGLTNFAIDINGDVWGWGANNFGQLANGKLDYEWITYHDPMAARQKTSYSSTPNPTPEKINGISNVLDISAHISKVFALTKDGEIWRWGNLGEFSLIQYNGENDEYMNDALLSELNIQYTPAYVTKFSKWKAFSDVPLDFWGNDAITWAKEKGIVKGKGNNQFDPYGTLSEAEFIAMLAQLFSIEVNEGNGHWAQGRYDALAAYNLPLQGYNNSQAIDQPITRGLVASVIAASQGQASEMKSSVQWMYDNKLTTGKYNTGDIMKDYDPYGILTRAEAVKFVKNLYEQGITTIKK